MTKRVQLIEEPFNGIQVGDKVMFISSSFSSTRVNYGFYRGTHRSVPVVEYFYQKRKWYWDRNKMKYFQDKKWTIGSRRVFLSLGRVFNCNTLQTMFADTPTKEYLTELLEKD